jgi:hypothetical protein
MFLDFLNSSPLTPLLKGEGNFSDFKNESKFKAEISN